MKKVVLCSSILIAVACNPQSSVNKKVVKYWENGNKKVEGSIVGGKQTGTWISWNESGIKTAEINYLDGILNGTYTSWNKDGKIDFQENYLEGKLHGISFIIINGDTLNASNYEHDRLVWEKLPPDMELPAFAFNDDHYISTEYYKNGNKKSVREYNYDNQIDGKSFMWYENGNKNSEWYFKKGKRHGECTSWYENGAVENVRVFQNGKLIEEK